MSTQIGTRLLILTTSRHIAMVALPYTTVSRASNLRLLSTLLQPTAAAGRVKSNGANLSSTSANHQPARHELQSYTTTTSSSSVSAAETSHFSRLASTWWDPHGPSRLLHLMNPHRHSFISACLASGNPDPNPPPRSYLDIGCGGGIFAESAARLRHTAKVTAIDPTPAVLAVAKEHARTDPALAAPKLTYIHSSIEDLPVPEAEAERADVLTLFEVLEHVDRPAAFLQACLPHLKPGGWLIGSTIARSPLSFLTTKLVAEAPVIGIVPRGTHDWSKYINPDELRAWFEQRGQQGGKKGEEEEGRWGDLKTQGVIYVPGWGWKMLDHAEALGNYFFGVQKPIDVG